MNTRGFLLIEALLALMILVVAVTAALGSFASALKTSKICLEGESQISEMQKLFFDLRMGERSDLILWGGKAGEGRQAIDFNTQASASPDFRSMDAVNPFWGHKKFLFFAGKES